MEGMRGERIELKVRRWAMRWLLSGGLDDYFGWGQRHIPMTMTSADAGPSLRDDDDGMNLCTSFGVLDPLYIHSLFVVPNYTNGRITMGGPRKGTMQLKS